MPVCPRCGVGFLDSEQHVCAPRRGVVVPLGISVIGVVLPLALRAAIGTILTRHPLPPDAFWIGSVLLTSTLGIGAWLVWRAWTNGMVVLGYIVAMIPVSFLFALWFGVKFLGQDMP